MSGRKQDVSCKGDTALLADHRAGPRQEYRDMRALFDSAVSRGRDRTAIIYFDQALSYGDIDTASTAMAHWLVGVGITGGDRVAILLQNMPQLIIMTVAAWKIGAIPVPGNPMYRGQELARIFADCEPAALICLDDHVSHTLAGLELAGLTPKAMLVTSAGAFQGRNDPRVLPPATGTAQDFPTLEDILAQSDDALPLAPVAISPDDLGLILYTSGTTGVPKGAMIRHSSLAFNAQRLRDACALGPQSRILGIAPFFHITGFSCQIGGMLSAGASIILNYRVEPSLLVDMIREHRPTFVIGAITAFNALMNVPGVTAADMASFERVYSGGAPVSPALRDQIRDKLGFAIYSAYGMTETTAQTHLAPFGVDVPVDPVSGALSIGKLVPDTQARIVDDDGRTLPVGQVGELLVRGPQVTVGYWRKPQDTAAALTDGWLRTGDVAFVDEEGWYYLVDRKKDVIIASGFKVWPREVEDVLYGCEGIREAAVVGVADSYRGETVRAFVSAKPGHVIDPARVIAHCRAHLAAYKVPRTVCVLDDLPKTATGKIQRIALRQDAIDN